MQMQFEKHTLRLLQKDAAALAPMPHVNQIITKQQEQQCWAQEQTCVCIDFVQLLLVGFLFFLWPAIRRGDNPIQPDGSKRESLQSGAMMSR